MQVVTALVFLPYRLLMIALGTLDGSGRILFLVIALIVNRVAAASESSFAALFSRWATQ